MIFKKIKTYFEVKGNEVLERKVKVQTKLKMAEKDLKNSKEKLIDKIVELNTKKKRFEKKINNLEDEKLKEDYQKLIVDIESVMDPLINKKKEIDKKIEDFDYKKDKLESQFELLQAQKEIQEMSLEDLNDDNLFGDLIKEIEESIDDYEAEIDSVNELVDKNVIK